jgi:hypothetical protein
MYPEFVQLVRKKIEDGKLLMKNGNLLGVANIQRRSIAPLTRSSENMRDSAEGDKWFTNVHVGRLNLLDKQHTKSAPTLNPSSRHPHSTEVL